MPWTAEFADLIRKQEPLAPFTYLRLGGPAQFFAEPRGETELAKLVRRTTAEAIPLHVLAGGCNLLIRDEGVPGLVVRLSDPAFAAQSIVGHRLRCGAGCPITAAISESARHSLSGLENLIGIPGTIGGGLRSNVGSRAGNLIQLLHAIEWLTPLGEVQRLEGDDIPIETLTGTADTNILLAAEFNLEPDDSAAILRRMRKLWIQKKARQPLSFQAVGRLFKAPRGLPIEQFLEEAGVAELTVGGASLSERNPNYVVVREGATARDVLRLIEMIRTAVADKLGQTLQLALNIW